MALIRWDNSARNGWGLHSQAVCRLPSNGGWNVIIRAYVPDYSKSLTQRLSAVRRQSSAHAVLIHWSLREGRWYELKADEPLRRGTYPQRPEAERRVESALNNL